MSEQKALQFLDKNDLECAICLERLTEPKTLECLHSYCLHCLQSLIKTSGKIKCPKCCKMYDDLNQFDLKDLTTNEMLSYQVKYVGNIESEKPPKCSSCDNQPEYYCSECQMYLCGQCIKHHEIIPLLKDHSLYTLDKNEGEKKDLHNTIDFEKIESEKPPKCSGCDDNQPEYYCSECKLYLCGQCIHQHKIIPVLKDHSLYTLDKNEEDDLPDKCKFHRDRMLEFYCRTCSKSGCKRCEHILRCYQNEHNVITFKIAVDEFNQNVTEVMRSAEEIKEKLEGTRDTVTKERSDFESRIQICRKAIDLQEENLIKKIQEKSREMATDLNKIDKENKELVDDQVKHIDSKLTKVNEMLPLINTMMNKPEERETLESHETDINAVKEEVVESKYKESIKITPSFIPSKNFDKVINLEGIGKMSNAKCAYEVAKDDESITVTKGQSFETRVVSSSVESETSHLSATLINESGKQSATEIKHQGSGEYKITGRCHQEGDWKMMITNGPMHIKGSPVDIKVEPIGLVHTIDNIDKLRGDNKDNKVTDVILDKDGCIIVSRFREDLLKFNQEYSYIGRIEVPEDVNVICMHQIAGDNCIVYGDTLNKTVVKCDNQFNQICTFGRGMLKDPCGLTVNKETRTMYVTDSKCNCVFKFNVDNGRFLGKIGSLGIKKGQMDQPEGLTLTKEGNLIIAEFGNNRIQMFDANDKFIRNLVGSGKEDGYVEGAYDVTIDSEENMLVSSYNKLQLFDKDGFFIKRIDDGGLDVPCGLALISNRPRRVAVANHETNNLKIYNY
ncbi:uncharacterized protein [Antedon mediterranea]|uniref:uncharacterized protein n=1 Tax=Antedon mediterranea TaxID=105859 RepID=UPI003AF62205